MKNLYIFTLLLVSCQILNAQNKFSNYKTIKEIDVALEKCYNNADNTNLTSNCAYNASDAADKILNQLYKKVLGVVNPKFKPVLINSQRQWLNYKSNDAKLQEELYTASPGTMWIPTLAHRTYELIKERCEYLETILVRFE